MKRTTRCRLLSGAPLFWICLFVAGALPSAAQEQLVLSVRHDHSWGSCSGTLTLDQHGVRYETSHSKDARQWTYDEVQQFQVEENRRLEVLTYEDRKWRFGADRLFVFDWEENGPTPEEVYRFIGTRVLRPIAAWLSPSDPGEVRFAFPVKHLGIINGTQGRLLFTDDRVVLMADQADKNQDDRTWRYLDLESISSSGQYELTLTTYERQRFHYASRRVYRFQLREPLPSETYNALWRFVTAKLAEH